MQDLKTILSSCGEYFKIPYVVADFTIDEQPLIFVNDSFTELSGYSGNDILC